MVRLGEGPRGWAGAAACAIIGACALVLFARPAIAADTIVNSDGMAVEQDDPAPVGGGSLLWQQPGVTVESFYWNRESVQPLVQKSLTTTDEAAPRVRQPNPSTVERERVLWLILAGLSVSFCGLATYRRASQTTPITPPHFSTTSKASSMPQLSSSWGRRGDAREVQSLSPLPRRR